MGERVSRLARVLRGMASCAAHLSQQHAVSHELHPRLGAHIRVVPHLVRDLIAEPDVELVRHALCH